VSSRPPTPDPGREPLAASFETRPLVPRRRRFDPVVGVVACIVLGLGLAVLKPWEAGPDVDTAVGATASAAPSAAASSPAPAASDGAAAAGPVLAPSVAWRRVAPVVRTRDAWGVRAIVRDPAATPATESGTDDPLTERWAAVRPVDGDARPVVLETPDQGILALGVTFPPDELPLDVRVWLAAADDTWTWVGANPLHPAPALGGYLLGSPTIRGTPLETWPAGRYRIDVLSGAGIRHLHVAVPDRFEVVPPPDGPAAATDPSLRSPFAPRFPDDAPPGPFLVAAGEVLPFHADAEAEPRDAAALWRDGTAGTHAPDATGLGLLFPPESTEASATLHLVAPLDRPAAGRRALGMRFAEERSPFVVFRAPNGAAWASGTYRLEAVWTAADGERASANYHLELLPAPDLVPAMVLDAARGFRQWAGRIDALVGMPAFAEAAEQDLACLEGNEAVVTETPTVIGLGHEPDRPPGRVSGELQFDGGRLATQPVLVATEALPGLTLVAPARSTSFAPGVYRLTLEEADGPRTLVLCAGVIIIE
jgi:hypothetical protein